MPGKSEFVPTKVLVTVKTYLHPSRKYVELVCTAGITEEHEWVRLYPVDFRYQSPEKQYEKYQWIEVGLAPRGSGNDRRKESRKPDLDSIRALGAALPTLNAWSARRKIVDAMPQHTVLDLKRQYEESGVSLGIVRPTAILDLEIRKSPPRWKSGQEQALQQISLFYGQPKPLEKLPFTFRYVFRCEDIGPTPHKAMIEDWELGALFLKMREAYGDDWTAAQKVREKYLDQICGPTRDTRFFMGTVFPYNTWVVVGVFWPPKISQPSLF